MILTELKIYLQEKKRVTLIDIALHFSTSPEAMRGMLEHWIRKEKLRLLPIDSVCSDRSCCKCNPMSLEIYEWIEKKSETRK